MIFKIITYFKSEIFIMILKEKLLYFSEFNSIKTNQNSKVSSLISNER